MIPGQIYSWHLTWVGVDLQLLIGRRNASYFITIPYNLISRQYRHREGVEISEDSFNVSSRQYQRYEFDARASAPYTLEDRIFTVAMHVNVSTYKNSSKANVQTE